MKILHVTRDNHEDKRYGMSRAVTQLQSGLRTRDVEIDGLCAGDLSPATVRLAYDRAQRWAHRWGRDLLPLFDVISRAWHTGVAAADLVRTSGNDPITHVHCHDAVIAHGYLHRARQQRSPWGVTQHSFDTIANSLHHYYMPLPSMLRSLLLRLEREVFEQAQWVIFPTGLGAARVSQGLGLDGELPPNWFVLPHAKRPWQLPPRETARQRLGWRDDERILLCVGQLIPLKRIDWVVQAMKGAPSPWRLVILGEGDSNGLHRVAAEAGIAPPLITATDDPRDYFAGADAFTSASATESFGMAHIEALQAGLPCACTAVGGVPELMGDACVLLPDEFDAYVQGLHRFLADELVLRQSAERARVHAATLPGVDEVARQHIEIYRIALR
ncbi:glycosyltransferase family 4 protein [Nitrosomonas communis]|uniref:glycosyltransferase family 4 protein n=1 Tax=Nitrosomonas communis TaxID=44574 RepID=UPI0026EDFD87|nr:glycosyltransferase family 4 protein [Nitrosomonas communis]MCO6427160.1 glycosyltransferase family 4 protein [Nitrosomonas communis]